jgi:hypothetical protein
MIGPRSRGARPTKFHGPRQANGKSSWDSVLTSFTSTNPLPLHISQVLPLGELVMAWSASSSSADRTLRMAMGEDLCRRDRLDSETPQLVRRSAGGRSATTSSLPGNWFSTVLVDLGRYRDAERNCVAVTCTPGPGTIRASANQVAISLDCNLPGHDGLNVAPRQKTTGYKGLGCAARPSR